MSKQRAQSSLVDLSPKLIEVQSWILAPDPEHTLTKRLLERKLSAETISHFQISPHGNGWQYPAAGGKRWKNYDSSAEPKYSWLDGGKPEGAELYYTGDIVQSIQSSSGACWLVSGEPDVWAMRSAGINHALSGFTENHAPNDLALFLASLGVTVLYIAPDLDPTGERWARKIASALEGSPIELDCRALPAELGAKADLGKAWQQYTKLMPFERWLTGLPRYYPEPEKAERTEPAQTTGGEHTEIPQDYRLELISRLGVSKFSAKGFSINQRGKAQNVFCPFHPDKHPSASVHEYKGLYCHTEGEWYSWQKLGEKLGLGSLSEWLEANRAETPARAGLTTELREALIKAGLTAAARVLDLLYALGWNAGHVFSRAEAERALTGKVSGWSVRAALEPKTTKAKNIFCGIFPPFLITTVTKEKNHKKSKGRPSKLYTMPSLSQIAEALGSKIGNHKDIIKPEKITSSADYKAEVYAAPIRRKAGTYARKTLIQKLGITTRTAQSYDKRAALVVTERFNREPAMIEKISEIESQPEADRKRNCWLENGEIYITGKRKGKPRRFSVSVEMAGRALESSPDGNLWLVTQLTNHYRAGNE